MMYCCHRIITTIDVCLWFQLDEEREKQLMKELEIEEDEFMKQYHMKRLMELKKEHENKIAMSR